MRSWSSINVLCTEPGVATRTDSTTPPLPYGYGYAYGYAYVYVCGYACGYDYAYDYAYAYAYSPSLPMPYIRVRLCLRLWLQLRLWL